MASSTWTPWDAGGSFSRRGQLEGFGAMMAVLEVFATTDIEYVLHASKNLWLYHLWVSPPPENGVSLS